MLTGQARRHCVPLRPCWVCPHPDGLDFPSLGYNVQIPTCRPEVQKGLVKRLGPVQDEENLFLGILNKTMLCRPHG